MKLLYIISGFLMMLFKKRTIGTRILVIQDNKILMVRHTYIHEWYIPGGGVDLKESPLQGAIRELKEEVGILVQGELKLLGIYYHIYQGHDDYVAAYICKDFSETDHIDSSEILEKRWFPLDNLPKDISEGSLNRIQEYLNLKPLSDQW